MAFTLHRDGSGDQVTDAQMGIVKLTITLKDRDDTTAANFDPKDYYTITDKLGKVRTYVLTNSNDDGSIATGDVLTSASVVDNDGSDVTLGATIAALGTCIAVSVDLDAAEAKQRVVGNELLTAIAHANGHAGSFTASGTFADTDGEGSVVLEAAAGLNQATPDISKSASIADSVSTVANTQVVGNTNHILNSYAAVLDDSSDVETRLLEIMEESALGSLTSPGTTIINTEYEAQFLPGIRAFKKKVK
jgi:hypothetical protein